MGWLRFLLLKNSETFKNGLLESRNEATEMDGVVWGILFGGMWGEKEGGQYQCGGAAVD